MHLRACTITAITLLASAPAMAQMGSAASAGRNSNSTNQAKPDAEPQPATAGQVRPSKAAQPALIALQNAINAGDANAIRAAAAAAQAASTTKEDRYMVGQLQLKGALQRNDDAAASAAIDVIAGSGFLDSARVASLYSSLGGKLLKQKQYAEAATLLNRAAALTPGDLQAQILVGDAYLAGRQNAQALAIYQKALAARQAAGQKPDEGLYRRAVQAAFDGKSPAAADLSRQWVSAYPNKDSWRNSIAIFMTESKPDDDGVLDLLRLMRATGALTGPDIETYVVALTDASNFIEAQTVLDQASGVDGATVQKLKASLAGKPRVTAAELASAAKSAQSPTALLRIADRYYGLGDYANAAATYRAAKAKGVEASLADLRTGIALAGTGDKAAAAAALKSVGGARAGIAQYWLLYLQGRA